MAAMEVKPSPVKEKSISLLTQPPLEPISKLPSTETLAPIPPPPPQQKPSPSIPDLITIPSCSRWFSWENIHETERRQLPEFFNKNAVGSKNDRVYVYYRNSIIKMFRESVSKKITFTQARKVLVGDVGSIRRVFDFLENWGLINYTGMGVKAQGKVDNKENRSSEMMRKDSSARFCSGCKALCSIACFVCDKVDMTLCARCYVRGEYKETLSLLEAVMHFGEDWKKVAEHVACGRTERECVARFLKLPFKEQFISPLDSDGVENYYETSAETEERGSSPSSPRKKRRLTPFADTSNPIMAQVAFLSAMVGSRVAQAAARAGVEAVSSGPNPLEDGVVEAEVHIQKEEEDMEKAITNISQVQMKELEDKIVHFEQAEMEMEKEWKQLQYMKSLLFTDQLTLLFQKGTPSKMGESTPASKITSNLPT
ncbi:hypothetical protein ACHQM5_029713 [Ranunculus cassubicifolius]